MSKPYYKLTIGKKPYTIADMKFPCGRIKIEVNDAHPDPWVLVSLCDTRWGDACRKVLAFFDSSPDVSPLILTEPTTGALREEVARMDARAAARKAGGES